MLLDRNCEYKDQNILFTNKQLPSIDLSKKKEQDCTYVGPQLVISLYYLKIPFKIFSSIVVAEALHDFKTSSLLVYMILSSQDDLRTSIHMCTCLVLIHTTYYNTYLCLVSILAYYVLLYMPRVNLCILHTTIHIYV